MDLKLSYDNKSLLKNGERWFPVMGEIHYSRYPSASWKEALLKMKAGGVEIVSSYVIWIHHEEIENQWDFTGERNLREFVETIKECGLYMILRIGPWSHAEVRNGGFPDWLLAKHSGKCRTNDEEYFKDVSKFYKKTYEQVEGLLLKDGGPIIGVQIENEYGHCGGLWGEEGEKHMKRLTELAHESGFDVPLYTATGWGGAVTAGLLPVMGGYPEAPWDPSIKEIEASGNFVFTAQRNDHAIGSDYGMKDGLTYEPSTVPYLTAELGGGLQVTYNRRPVAQSKDIGCMSLAKIGSGCSLLGYYMYHGGRNPEGKLTTLEENKATGSPNDLLVKNYDFRAPLGEYGKANGSYKEIRLLSLFLKDFGKEIAGMDTEFPKDNPCDAGDYTSIRTSYRHAGNKGYVFVNNYQRRRDMAEHENVVLKTPDNFGSVEFAPVDIYNGDYYYLPVNMDVKGNLLKSALVSPLCKINDSSYAFYTSAHLSGLTKNDVKYRVSDVKSVKDADPGLYQFVGTDSDVNIITLSREDALNASKVTLDGKDYLIITDATLVQDGSKINLYARTSPFVKSYPELPSLGKGFEKVGVKGGFTLYKYTSPFARDMKVSCNFIKSEGKKTSYSIKVQKMPDAVSDVVVHIDYTGNCARLYGKNGLVDDNIYIGPSYQWEICLKNLGENEFTLEVDPLCESDGVFIEEWPSFEESSCISRVNSISATSEMLLTLC